MAMHNSVPLLPPSQRSPDPRRSPFLPLPAAFHRRGSPTLPLAAMLLRPPPTPPPHGPLPLPIVGPAAVFPISPTQAAATSAASPHRYLSRYHSRFYPLSRPIRATLLPTVRSVQLQPHDHLSAIAESGAVLCFSFASPSSLLLLLPPTAASVANVPPPVTVVPPSLAAAAASNGALCRCRVLLPLLHLHAAPVAPPCSSTGCRSNRCPSPPATSVPPCHCRRPPSSSSSVPYN
ncbi:hypothetical protein BHE74_00035852 [Ensete ventricosum]|nr:hypothetical protein BHE74_00035852 [Ensete ventricosum]